MKSLEYEKTSKNSWKEKKTYATLSHTIHKFNYLFLLLCSHPGLRVSPEANNWCPFMRKEKTERRSTEGRSMKVEAEVGVMCRQVRERQRLPDTVRN